MKLLKRVWRVWLKIVKPIGNFQAQFIFTFFYYSIFFVVGVVIRLFSDPLRIYYTKHRTSNFTPWSHPKESIEQAKKPY